MAKQSISELFDLTGKVAIVTGGAMGIGQAIALRLAEAGAFSSALKITEELWDKVMDINLKSTFYYAQAAARHMIEKESLYACFTRY